MKKCFLAAQLILLTCLGYSQSVKIGTQVWMTKNLDVSAFRNGDPITHASTNEDWQDAMRNKKPAWCYYDNDPTNGEKYGKLYNWYAVNDPRGLAPEGWRVPNHLDWSKLITFLYNTPPNFLKEKTGEAYQRTISTGFNCSPVGTRDMLGTFQGNNGWICFWSSDGINVDRAISYHIYPPNSGLIKFDNYKFEGFSVRCLKD